MLLEIAHRTDYRYSKPVLLEPLTLRLRPRSDAAQTLRAYDIRVEPTPTGISGGIGLDGNGTDTVWFEGLHDRLAIITSSVVETRKNNPFDFVITDDHALTLPLVYDASLRSALTQYLERPFVDDAVCALSFSIQQQAAQRTVRFLTLLAERLHTTFRYNERENGKPWRPRETLEKQTGACRDLALLYMDLCRCAGIAARFVSGYCYTDVSAECRLHAWVEVYLPGGGWIGFDPSEGLAVAERHVAVAAGPTADDATPTAGYFRGQAQTALTASIAIKKL